MYEFYYVYNPRAGKPTFRHDNQDSAIAEAKRLAAQSLDEKQEFIVLKAEYVCSYVPPVKTEKLSDVPF